MVLSGSHRLTGGIVLNIGLELYTKQEAEAAAPVYNDVTDVVDLEYLQLLQDSLGKVIQITTALLNPQGVPITRPTNLYAFCEMMQASESGVQMCMKTNAQLIEIGKSTRRAAIVTCPNSGLKTAAVPIFLGEQFLGSWLIGQMRTEEIDLELIEQTAVAAGLSVEEAKRNISILPVIAQQEFEAVLSFLEVFTSEITSLAETNDELDRKNKTLENLTWQLNSTNVLLRDFFALSDIGVYVTDLETGELLMVNDVFAGLLGRAEQSLLGQPLEEVTDQTGWIPAFSADSLLTPQGKPGDSFVWESRIGGLDRWMRMTSRAIHWSDGKLAHMVTFVDITDSKLQEEQISNIAYIDQRLGIPNGQKLHLDLCEHPEQEGYMICFDIQGLRKINDAYGREVGDQLLSEICRWTSGIEGTDHQLYRIDGDAFALLLSSTTEEEVLLLAQYIWNRYDEAWVIDSGNFSQKLYTRVSLGIIPTQGGFSSHNEIINVVERVLETAKQRNYPVIHSAELEEDLQETLTMELSLKECIFNNMQGFSLHYQPIVEAHSGRWVGLEALCRWNSPVLGNVRPDLFIELAEQVGLIDVVGDWVLREATSQLMAWGLDAVEGFTMDINLSPLQLNNRGLSNTVSDILREFSCPPSKISLEITESAEVHFDSDMMDVLNRLCETGITLSLDDFGTGYSSFASLKNLPVVILKTDRSFLHNIEQDASLQRTVELMVEFAHTAQMQVIAEGVETEEQREIMLHSGVDMIQGYFYSRPLTAEQVAEQLDRFFMQ